MRGARWSRQDPRVHDALSCEKFRGLSPSLSLSLLCDPPQPLFTRSLGGGEGKSKTAQPPPAARQPAAVSSLPSSSPIPPSRLSPLAARCWGQGQASAVSPARDNAEPSLPPSLSFSLPSLYLVFFLFFWGIPHPGFSARFWDYPAPGPRPRIPVPRRHTPHATRLTVLAGCCSLPSAHHPLRSQVCCSTLALQLVPE